MLTYVTTNPGKFQSANLFFPPYEIVQESSLDIPEPETGVVAVAGYKATYAREFVVPPLFVHDTSLYGEGLPGVQIGREVRQRGVAGVFAGLPDNHPCYCRQCVAYVDTTGEMSFFESEVPGRLVKRARGDAVWRWTDIWKYFIPHGLQQTLAELSAEEYREWTLSRQDGGLETSFVREYGNHTEILVPATGNVTPASSAHQ